MPTADPSLQYHPLVKSLARSLRQRCGVRTGSRLVVACSGGADSVALLRAMAMLGPRRRWRLGLTVAHVQHHLRPDPEAERDAAFVASLADQLDLPFERADVQAHARDDQGDDTNTESRARRLRYDALQDIAQRVGATAVATGHHADDQLETVLMRLLRGASLRGLAGMGWKRPIARSQRITLIRPMLGVDRAACHAYLADLQQPFCDDRTNRDVSRLRARLRHDVLPVLRDLRQNVASRTVRLGDDLRDAQRLVDDAARAAEQSLCVASQPDTLDRSAARSVNRLVLATVLRRRLLDLGVPGDRLSHRLLDAVVDAVHDRKGGQRVFDVAQGVSVQLTRQAIVFRVSAELR